MKVAVFDDEEKVCRLIIQLIPWQELGLELVATAGNGLEALEVVRQAKPDLVITDIRMPGMDGLELVRTISQQEPAPACVIISGYNQFEYAHQAIRYGVEDYLLKPIKESELIATLRKLVGRHQQRMLAEDDSQGMRQKLQASLNRLRREAVAGIWLDAEAVLDTAALNQHSGFAFGPGVFQLCVIKVDCAFGEYSEGLMRLLGEHAVTDFSAELRPLCHDLEFSVVRSRILLLLNYPEHNSEAVRRSLKKANDLLQIRRTGFGSIALSLAMGTSVLASSENTVELGDSILSAEEALGQRLDNRSGSLFLPVKPSLRPSAQATLAAWRDRLAQACTQADTALGDRAVAELRQDLHQLAGTSPGRELLFVEDAAGHMCAFAADQLANQAVAESGPAVLPLAELDKRFRLELELSGSLDKAYGLLGALTAACVGRIIAAREQVLSRPVCEAQRYIAGHFHDPQMSLEHVADLQGYNPSYFSELFKKEAGTGFLEYLTEIRIDQAKILLRDDTATIGQIAAKVGYTDTKYFAKLFRKHAGLKPSEYRKLYG